MHTIPACNISHPKIEAESKQDELVTQESRPSPEVCALSSSVYLFKSVSPTFKASTGAMCSLPIFPEDCFKDLFLTRFPFQYTEKANMSQGLFFKI